MVLHNHIDVLVPKPPRQFPELACRRRPVRQRSPQTLMASVTSAFTAVRLKSGNLSNFVHTYSLHPDLQRECRFSG